MDEPRKISKASNTSSNSTTNYARKARRSIKAEGNFLTAMLREGRAKVIDASKLGKRLSSEIWNSFGAIQVDDNFANPSIATKVVADGLSSMRICHLFVACSKCFSVFKYDGHAYGTTGLVKHVKICQGSNHRDLRKDLKTSDPNLETTTLRPPKPTKPPTPSTLQTTTPTTATARPRREPSSSKTGIKYLTKLVEETRCDLADLKQKINDLINLMNGTSYVGQIEILSNEGEKAD